MQIDIFFKTGEKKNVNVELFTYGTWWMWTKAPKKRPAIAGQVVGTHFAV